MSCTRALVTQQGGCKHPMRVSGDMRVPDRGGPGTRFGVSRVARGNRTPGLHLIPA
jgi:hypothetical protein